MAPNSKNSHFFLPIFFVSDGLKWRKKVENKLQKIHRQTFLIQNCPKKSILHSD
jgi:hypothetical protein